MCGIGGILRTWARGEAPPGLLEAIPEAWLDILDESIKHRGPDGCGRFRQRVVRVDGVTVDVALVHRRLSIIDHAGGGQPMVIGCAGPESAGARVVGDVALISREGLPYGPLRAHVCPKCGPGVAAVVFNGCIYNHRELRRELEGAGHEFFTDHSDTEVLLHGWREWGDALERRVDGMLASAAWESSRGALHLSRDFFGEKPLYRMGIAENAFAWCSAPAGLLCLSSRTEAASPRSIRVVEWIRSGWHNRTVGANGLIEVPRAGRAECTSEGAPAEGGFGLPHWLDRAGKGSAAFSITTAERLLESAVRSRLVADVPLGCFLSGGVDSSLIASFASRVIPDLQTFTVAMPDPRYDESRIARTVASHLGVRHTVLPCRASPAADLVGLVEQLGLPFGDSSLLPTSWVCEAVRSVAPVALGGDGGDELFAGYERHAIDPGDRGWRMLAQVLPSRVLPSRNSRTRAAKARRLLAAMKHHPASVAPELAAIFPARELARLLGTQSELSDLLGAARRRAASTRLFDLDEYLPGDLLRKSDTASMRVALEVRAPFLEPTLAEQAIRTPITVLMPRGQRKGLLRAIARKHLPAEVVDRPKMGFAIPVGEWFRTDYGGMRQLLYDHVESADPFPGLAEAGVEINMGFVRRMMREHDAAGERSLNPWHGRDHSQRLYMLVVLSIWCRWLRGL